jgi:hypothetical protein
MDPPGAAFGASLSDPGVNDPRLIEQPQSAIAIAAIGKDARQPSREAPEKRWGTGIAIYAECSRG